MTFDRNRRISATQTAVKEQEDGSYALSPAQVLVIMAEAAFTPLSADGPSAEGRGRARRLVAGILQAAVADGLPVADSERFRTLAIESRGAGDEAHLEFLHLASQIVQHLTFGQYSDAMTRAGIPVSGA